MTDVSEERERVQEGFVAVSEVPMLAPWARARLIGMMVDYQAILAAFDEATAFSKGWHEKYLYQRAETSAATARAERAEADATHNARIHGRQLERANELEAEVERLRAMGLEGALESAGEELGHIEADRDALQAEVERLRRVAQYAQHDRDCPSGDDCTCGLNEARAT
jgi:hypothetical protein